MRAPVGNSLSHTARLGPLRTMFGGGGGGFGGMPGMGGMGGRGRRNQGGVNPWFVMMAIQLWQQIDRLEHKPPITLGIMAGRSLSITEHD